LAHDTRQRDLVNRERDKRGERSFDLQVDARRFGRVAFS
jgi:hypothetical protein